MSEDKAQEEEKILTDSNFLITRTDLNGAITYANEDFCTITGYSKSELIGHNHNIIRHPDMPLQIFRELWKTVKKGKKWTGYVKNKTRDGKFYWVEAEVSTFIKNGKILGYKSIRKKASEEVIKQIDRKYEKIKKDEVDEFSSWTVEKENYEAFNALSKKLQISKKELFEKMLQTFQNSIKL